MRSSLYGMEGTKRMISCLGAHLLEYWIVSRKLKTYVKNVKNIRLEVQYFRLPRYSRIACGHISVSTLHYGK